MKRSTTRAFNALFFGMGLFGLAWLIHRIGIDTIRDGLAEVGIGFAVACLAHLGAILLDAVTLRACAGQSGEGICTWIYARASLAGHGISQATPLGKVGELTKFTLLAEHMPGESAAAALIVQNFVMWAISCGLIACAPIVALIGFDVESTVMAGLWICGGVFLLLGIGALALMWRGVGELPLRLLRLVRVRPERAEKWRRSWREVESAWRQATASPRHMRRAFISSACSRLCDFAESTTILALLGVEHAFATAVVAIAGYQVVAWMIPFVPMQAGTAEGAAYLLFQSLGESPAVGVMYELVRRARRLVFVAIAVGLLGWHATRQMIARDRASGKQG